MTGAGIAAVLLAADQSGDAAAAEGVDEGCAPSRAGSLLEEQAYAQMGRFMPGLLLNV